MFPLATTGVFCIFLKTIPDLFFSVYSSVLCSQSPCFFAEEVVTFSGKARWQALVAKHAAWIKFRRWQGRRDGLDGYCKHACDGFYFVGWSSNGPKA